MNKIPIKIKSRKQLFSDVLDQMDTMQLRIDLLGLYKEIDLSELDEISYDFGIINQTLIDIF